MDKDQSQFQLLQHTIVYNIPEDLPPSNKHLRSSRVLDEY